MAALGSLSDAAAVLTCCGAVLALVCPAFGCAGSACKSVAVAALAPAAGCVCVRLPSWSDERGSGTALEVVSGRFEVMAAGAFAAAVFSEEGLVADAGMVLLVVPPPKLVVSMS
jgi:hypothetical protein